MLCHSFINSSDGSLRTSQSSLFLYLRKTANFSTWQNFSSFLNFFSTLGYVIMTLIKKPERSKRF